jgi:hypothetical protein
MDLTDAADLVREKLTEHRISPRTNLWLTILKQIKKKNSFDGDYVETILEIIRSFLSQLDDQTTIDLWRTTETGLLDDSEDDCLFPDSVRMNLEFDEDRVSLSHFRRGNHSGSSALPARRSRVIAILQEHTL